MRAKAIREYPTIEEMKAELRRYIYKKQYGQTLRSTVYALIVVSAVAILVASLWLPVFRIFGVSMTPTLDEGEIVAAVKGSAFEKGDVVALWYNNKLLVKRVIGAPGEWINIDSKGNVFVDGEKIDEPYVSEKALGDCNITLPYQVPEGRYFVMGDHRSTSQDSRNTAVGCIAEEQIIGKIVFRVWPLESIGFIE